MKNVIIGAGVTGLTLAAQMDDCVVIEQSPKLLGSAGSWQEDGYTFDRGIHVINTLTEDNKNLVPLLEVKRNAKIQMMDKLEEYPYQKNNVDMAVDKEFDNYYDYLVARFGPDAETFHIPYNEKFWGMDLRLLSPDWTKKPYFPKKGATTYGANDTFWYPAEGGIGALGKKLFERVEHKVHFNKRVDFIDFKSRTLFVNYFDMATNGQENLSNSIFQGVPWKNLYNTQLDLLGYGSGVNEEIAKLKHTSIYVYTFAVKHKDLLPEYQDLHWVYFPFTNTPYLRASFPTHWAPYTAPKGMSIIQCESPVLVKYPLDALKVCRILKDKADPKLLMVDPKMYAYCIPTLETKAAIERINEFSERHDIRNVGRFGRWENKWTHECMAEKV